MSEVKVVKPFINGRFVESETQKYTDAYNPNTGEVIAKVPCCTKDEVERAIAAAKAAFPAWSGTPVIKRVQVLYKLRELLIEHMDELTHMVAFENGKAWEEAAGDVLKAKEATEQAIAAPSLLMGESLMDTSSGFDTVLYREPLGVFAGIVPFNFPAMIPMGWMTPMCIACGNTIVIKAGKLKGTIHAVLDREPEEGDKSYGRGYVEGHSPHDQRQQAAEERQRQHADKQSCLPEFAEGKEEQDEHHGQRYGNDDCQASVGPALVFELPVPVDPEFGMVVCDLFF